MARKGGTRVWLAEGIYQDAYGIDVVVSVGTGTAKQTLRERYPLGTDLNEMIAWRLRAQADLVEEAPLPVQRGTLTADVPRFLDTLPLGPLRRDYAILLKHWTVTALGDAPRHTITRQDVRLQMTAWLNAGIAANTVNHRVRALRMLYRALDGEDADTPCDKIKRLRGPEEEARGIPLDLVQLLLNNLPDRGRALRHQPRSSVSETKIRLRVIAWTGMPHMQLERLGERDVDFAQAKIRLSPRRKGKGAKAVWLDLLPQAVEALRDYAAQHLWRRSFSRSSMRQSWVRTIARTFKQAAQLAKETGDSTLLTLLERHIPKDCHPYDLRHSFLTEVVRVTKDLRAAAELGQQADIRTTNRYSLGAVPELAANAIAAMKQHWSPPAPAPAPAQRKRQTKRPALKIVKGARRKVS